MPENENASAAPAPEASAAGSDSRTGEGGDASGSKAAGAKTESAEEITYHAVEKEGQVTAIWEMQGRKHLRTIDPRSRQGQEILRLYTAEHADEGAAGGAGAAPGGAGEAATGSAR